MLMHLLIAHLLLHSVLKPLYFIFELEILTFFKGHFLLYLLQTRIIKWHFNGISWLRWQPSFGKIIFNEALPHNFCLHQDVLFVIEVEFVHLLCYLLIILLGGFSLVSSFKVGEPLLVLGLQLGPNQFYFFVELEVYRVIQISVIFLEQNILQLLLYINFFIACVWFVSNVKLALLLSFIQLILYLYKLLLGLFILYFKLIHHIFLFGKKYICLLLSLGHVVFIFLVVLRLIFLVFYLEVQSILFILLLFFFILFLKFFKMVDNGLFR